MTPDQFAETYGPAAERASASLGTDPKVLLGQWGLETGWGKSIIPGTNNLGNIKDFKGTGVTAKDNMNGSVDKYRAYASVEDFADDYASLIKRKYPGAVGKKDAGEFATALKAGGYAEDPTYIAKVQKAASMLGMAVTGSPAPQSPTEAPTSLAKARNAIDPDYPVLPTARFPEGVLGTGKKKVEDSELDLLLKGKAQTDAFNDADQKQEAESRRQVEAANVQARKDATGFSDVVSTAVRDPRIMSTFVLLDAMTRDDEAVPQGWDYMANRDAIEAPCGANDDCRAYMRENVKGPESMARAHAQQAYRADLDSTYSDAGGLAAFSGQMVGGLADPVGFAAGLGVGKAFQLARIGHAAKTLAGSAAMQTGAYLTEAALGNVAVEGLADALGEVKTSADYVNAAVSGAILAAPFSRGVFRSAMHDHAMRTLTDLNEKGIQDQIGKLSETLRKDPTLDPETAARKVEEQETRDVQDAVRENSGGTSPFNRRVVPEDVANEMRADAEGTLKFEDTTEGKELLAEQAKLEAEAKAEAETVRTDKEEAAEKPVVEDAPELPPFRPLEEQRRDTVKDMRETGAVSREWQDGDLDVSVRWKLQDKDFKGTTHSVGEILDAVGAVEGTDPLTRASLEYLAKAMSQEARGVRVRFTAAKARSNYTPGRGVLMGTDHRMGDIGAGKGLLGNLNGLSDFGRRTLAHELVHVATMSKIEGYLALKDRATYGDNPDLINKHAVGRIVAGYESLFERYVKEAKKRGLRIDDKTDSQPGYAALNMHEFAAQALTDPETRQILREMPGMPVAGKSSSAMADFLRLVKETLGFSKNKRTTGLDEAMNRLDAMILLDPKGLTDVYGVPLFASAAVPVSARYKMMQRWADSITNMARQEVAANPIDKARLKVLTDRIGGTSDGLVLANSKNPLLQYIASLVVETTTGAAGRGPTVAIRQPALDRRLVGNFRVDYDNAYATFRTMNKGSALEDIYKGDVKRSFDRQVYEEIYSRRDPTYTPQKHASIREAADAVEKVMERARLAQVEAGTMGSGHLPTTSRGYIPQALDGRKLANASPQDLVALSNVLSNSFQATMGWTKAFADDFAPIYLERVRLRTMGTKEFDMQAAGGDTMAIVRDVLDDLGKGTGNLATQAAAEMNRKGGLAQVKKRLTVDMTAPVGAGRVMDFYVTDVDLLTRQYARRTSGNVALTEVGIHGQRGIDQLMEAAIRATGSEKSEPHEVDALRRVFAEITGSPVQGAVVSAGATNLRLLVSLQRLGSLVFTQAAEGYNMLHTLGLRSALDGVASLPRMLGEVGRQKKGGDAKNARLWSVETIGGEIGQESYKMVAPLDAPDHALGAYMDNPGLFSRVLRAGGHLQSKVSGFRGLMAAQHRAVAEQIVMKSLRMIRDGVDDVSLKDMGFTPDVAAAVKAELGTIAKWDARDSLESLDLTLMSDPRIAEAFVQAVHRGTSQIIQGTFAGERNKWFHNDYLNMMMQLRTFGLTATEKQWGRTRMNHGYTYAAAFLLGQVAMSMPIHAARVAALSAGREDRNEYLKDNLNPAALVRASMNYASLSGVTGDILELISSVGGGFMDESTKETLGIKQSVPGVSRLIPGIGTLDQGAKVLSGNSSTYNALKQLPFSNLWYLVPAINLTK